ncbi:DMT family transporter [Halovivax gelatinilyticus]|uniref:DMT family transporter n=1 Tax=Halovivax gelatinilyticus TaxID=2961597 RepID=UPI0020CA66EE|nr:multidrug efflux SMR transporter [Halovivax gelatinilyticus]
MTKDYLFLGAAIATEVIGTSVLKLSDGFGNARMGVIALGAYTVSIYFVSLAIRDLPIGLVYATWSAFGIVGVAMIGLVAFDEAIDLTGIVGMAFVLVGIVLLNVYSAAYSPG